MSTNTATLQSPSVPAAKNNTRAMTVIGTLFFLFGFVTWLNSVLIPFLKQACELSDFQVYFVTFAFYISYFIMAIPSSAILRKVGFANGMSVGLLTMAVGSLIFIPAAQARSFPLFLVGLFVQGAGMTLLQAASNPYVTIIGPIESAAQRMSIMGICNKVAAMIGILLLGVLLFSDTTELSAKIETLQGAEKEAELTLLAGRVITPYIIMAIVLVGLALMVRKANLPEVKPEEESTEETAGSQHTSIFGIPYLMLGILCLFLYVGVEVLAIDSLALYGEVSGFEKNVALHLSIYSLVSLTIGYLLGIVLVPKYLSQRSALIICSIMGALFTAGALLTTGKTSVIFIILLSFAHSLMWPGIWPLAINKLGKFTKLGSAFLIMAIAGGATLPLVYGALCVEWNSRQTPYIIMIPCYLYILYYAAAGYKKGLPTN
ncbi:sugar MFS transporter [Chitinophaga nivalis]|uniref:Sugar MFS transporter n=1 Tax=Chitinophaga nivalis TaxID=2991709 RepID=A0ABT3IRW2_9BACT|nr:sugar MFS transporter [Chitinophaga nivalis]MCW3463621.1 sugar MFS transporter [Chitinophaga nivalis]MCW3486689.1 sugar MFS transporter [Chitinophaga nivalis]